MKWVLVIVTGLLTHFIPSSTADECAGENDVNRNNKVAKSAPLHHIIEFGKRSKVEVKGCEKKNSTNSNPKSSGIVLGLHGLLHARSQLKNKQNKTKGRDKMSSSKTITFEKPKNEPGKKRTSGELHKLQLRAETISMLHKIVEKYFPGGHLTVDQKIKALKILGKLIKLKKEGKNSDIKKLLGTLSAKHQNVTSKSTSNDSKLVKEKAVKVLNSKSEKKDNSNESDGGDIYANIANGPDVPKLPPTINDKDLDHAHSNIMPVGLQPMGGAGEMTNTINRLNDISENVRDIPSERVSSYRSPLDNAQAGMDLGQIYQNGNSFMRNSMSLSSIPNMMDEQGYVRSRMPYPRGRYRGRGWLPSDARRRYYDYDDDGDDDDDEDDGDDEDDEDGEDDDEDEDVRGRARSFVNRRRFYDDDDDNDANDEVMEYSRRFYRKDKIANPKKSKSKLGHNKNYKMQSKED